MFPQSGRLGTITALEESVVLTLPLPRLRGDNNIQGGLTLKEPKHDMMILIPSWKHERPRERAGEMASGTEKGRTTPRLAHGWGTESIQGRESPSRGRDGIK